MDTDAVLSAFRHELRHLERPGDVVQRLPLVTRFSYGESSEVNAFALTAENADAAIRGEVEHFRSLEKELEWKVFSFDSPPDLLDRLRAAGFEVGDREALVIYDLAQGLGPFQADGDVRRVTSLEGLEDFRHVAEAAFDRDYADTVAALAEALRSGKRGHDAYVAYADGVPVSVGRMYTDPKSAFAGLYSGGTLPDYRGRGYYRAVTAARARDAVELGARYLQVDALPTSLPILLRLGFTHAADTWPCSLGDRLA